jgi:hypothetical protein
MSSRTFLTDLKQDSGIRDTGLSSIRSKSAEPIAYPQSSKISYVNGGEVHCW